MRLLDEAARCQAALQACAASKVYQAKAAGNEIGKAAAKAYFDVFSALPGITETAFWADVAQYPDGLQHVFKTMAETYARHRELDARRQEQPDTARR